MQKAVLGAFVLKKTPAGMAEVNDQYPLSLLLEPVCTESASGFSGACVPIPPSDEEDAQPPS